MTLNNRQFQGSFLTPEQYGSGPRGAWHGSPSGEPGSGNAHYGLHVGTREAARQSLNARIGRPADGRDWDGTREYGQTLLGGYHAGYHSDAPEHAHLPSGKAGYSDGTSVPLTARPSITPVRIVGEMTNTPDTPHEDFKANGLMAGQIKRGTARRGYYYENAGEDSGSISAVVPGRSHLQTYSEYLGHIT